MHTSVSAGSLSARRHQFSARRQRPQGDGDARVSGRVCVRTCVEEEEILILGATATYGARRPRHGRRRRRLRRGHNHIGRPDAVFIAPLHLPEEEGGSALLAAMACPPPAAVHP